MTICHNLSEATNYLPNASKLMKINRTKKVYARVLYVSKSKTITRVCTYFTPTTRVDIVASTSLMQRGLTTAPSRRYPRAHRLLCLFPPFLHICSKKTSLVTRFFYCGKRFLIPKLPLKNCKIPCMKNRAFGANIYHGMWGGTSAPAALPLHV